jgi:Cu/Ag efflux protein CusF
MLRRFLAGLAALVLVAGLIVAEEIKAKVKEVTDDKITVTANDKDHTFDLTDDVKVMRGDKQVPSDKAKASLKRLKEGANITIVVEKKGGKDVLTEVKLKARAKKDK